ncbi:MAG: hypothetical protein GXY74_10795 [Phycisphaerae bacterium]|nr:hypothetical protein [Phycisphaerae bacterium]
MDRRGRLDRVRRYLILAAIMLAALWSYPVPVDVPLYSKTTGLPIFHTSNGMPIYGDPANCGCCGGGGGPFDSACGNCAANTTPLQVEVALSGITACTFCQWGGWGGSFYWKPTSGPNGTFTLARDPTSPCLFTAETTWSYNRYGSSDSNCSGAATAETGVVHIELERVSATTWQLTVWAEWPNFPAMGIAVFIATKTVGCDAEWTATNGYANAGACSTLPPQATIAFYGGSASVRPIP